MGVLARVISAARAVKKLGGAKVLEVITNPSAGANRRFIHAGDLGDDSQPLKDDLAVVVDTPRTGDGAIVGYIDTKNAGITEPGEKRIYARDADGVIVAQVRLKNSGEVVASNSTGTWTLAPDGSFVFNSGGGTFELSAGGDATFSGIVTAQDFVAGGISLTGHTHGGVETGDDSTGGPQ